MKKPKNPKKGDIWDADKEMYFYDGEDWVDITVMKEAFLEVVAGMAAKWIRKELEKIIGEGGDQRNEGNGTKRNIGMQS